MPQFPTCREARYPPARSAAGPPPSREWRLPCSDTPRLRTIPPSPDQHRQAFANLAFIFDNGDSNQTTGYPLPPAEQPTYTGRGTFTSTSCPPQSATRSCPSAAGPALQALQPVVSGLAAGVNPTPSSTPASSTPRPHSAARRAHASTANVDRMFTASLKIRYSWRRLSGLNFRSRAGRSHAFAIDLLAWKKWVAKEPTCVQGHPASLPGHSSSTPGRQRRRAPPGSFRDPVQRDSMRALAVPQRHLVEDNDLG